MGKMLNTMSRKLLRVINSVIRWCDIFRKISFDSGFCMTNYKKQPIWLTFHTNQSIAMLKLIDAKSLSQNRNWTIPKTSKSYKMSPLNKTEFLQFQISQQKNRPNTQLKSTLNFNFRFRLSWHKKANTEPGCRSKSIFSQFSKIPNTEM